MIKLILIQIITILVAGCNYLDDFLLGKDNSIPVADLHPLPPKVQLHKNWSVPVHAKSSTFAQLKPVIVDHIIYLADAKGSVQAVHQITGQVLWNKQLPHGIVGGPSILNNYIALTTDAASLILLRKNDGMQLWQTKVSSEILAKPVFADNKVIVKTIDGNLYAFTDKTGEKIWISTHGAPNLILKASSSPVVIANKLVLAGYADGKIDGVDLQTGRLIWQRSFAYANGPSDVERLVDIDADPIVRGDVAYLASYQGYVSALSLTDGHFIWRQPASVYRNMVIGDDSLYFTDSDDILWSINIRNGHVNWKQPALKGRGLTDPVIIGNKMIVGDKTGLLHIIARNNGNLISRQQLDGTITITPTVLDKHIYVVTNDGKLNSFMVG